MDKERCESTGASPANSHRQKFYKIKLFNGFGLLTLENKH